MTEADIRRAMNVIEDVLEAGPQSSSRVARAINKRSIPWPAYVEARRRLGVVADKDSGEWRLRLPGWEHPRGGG
jgi:hypothetical protein